ncbi:unnamed protein product [Orchesella dallaii]|uniref:Uncharacterized protein n=1 Tax=Orchesella dallaii TaxID=48710 RepID=A0ABP1R1B3_9HEXA
MASKHLITLCLHGFLPQLLVIMVTITISNCEEATTIPSTSPFALLSSSSTSGTLSRSQRSDENETQFSRLDQEKYYTMHQEHVTLEIRADDRIKWGNGTPTLFTVFRESMAHQKTSGERIFTLEAVATHSLICMNGKGRLYTINRRRFHKLKMRKNQRSLQKIRHIEKKKRIGWGGRRWMVGNGDENDIETAFPPADCVFKLHEFTPSESYERAVGIYSFKHSNSTHGRFLSLNPKTKVARTFRKPFMNLANHHNLKIRQVPVEDLEVMVRMTRFGRGEPYNDVVRECVIQLLINCKKKRWRRQAKREGGDHLPKIIERCKKRAVEGKVTPPKCSKKKRVRRRRNRKEAGENGRNGKGIEKI